MRRSQQGVTLIELLVALAVFALFVLMIDAVFFGANRSAKKTELAADVQQNTRISVERLTREIREAGAAEILTGGTPGHAQVVFKLARLPADLSVFCLYVRNTTDPAYMYNADCFTFPGGNLTPPPYAGAPAAPLGSYAPIWQQYVGYYVVDTPDGLHELRRVTGQLDTPGTALSLTLLTGGQVIATLVETFDLSISGSTVSVTLKGRGTEIVQGSAVPAQEILLPAQTLVRN